VSNGRMTDDSWNGNEGWRMRGCLRWDLNSWLEGLNKTTSNLVWKVSESRFVPGTCSIKSGVPPARPRPLVLCQPHILILDVTTEWQGRRPFWVRELALQTADRWTMDVSVSLHYFFCSLPTFYLRIRSDQ